MSSSEYFQLEKKLADFLIVQAIYTSIKLGLIDLLAAEGETTEQVIAARLDAHPKAIRHLLLLLRENGVVFSGFSSCSNADQQYQLTQYQLTPFGLRLKQDAPDSLYGLIMSYMELSVPAYGKLEDSIRTGRAGFEAAFHNDMYSYLENSSEAGKNFNQWMEASMSELVQTVLDTYDFTCCKHFVDVGGNKGQLAAGILKAHPAISGTLFDLTYATEEAPDLLDKLNVAARCTVVGGDFFKAVPKGGDLYIISRVLFNWNDVHALAILKQVRASMHAESRLLIIEMLLPASGPAGAELATSLNLLALLGVLLRTEEEYIALLQQAGFQVSRIDKLKNTEFYRIDAIPAVVPSASA